MAKDFSNNPLGMFHLIRADFIQGSHCPNQYLLYDPDTYVMYTYIGCASGGGICPMYNKDGSLRTFSDWTKDHPDWYK